MVGVAILEHQVLEEMREPGPAGLLVRPDAHQMFTATIGRVVFVQQHVEAVVQRKAAWKECSPEAAAGLHALPKMGC